MKRTHEGIAAGPVIFPVRRFWPATENIATEAQPLDFTQPWNFGDITFIVEEKKIYANKATLAMSSEVFKTMFTSDFAEREMTEIPLPDKEFGDFLELMQILHPQMLKRVDVSNVHRILPLAHEYRMQGVFDNCIRTLCRGPASIMSLNMVEKYDLKLPLIHKRCMKYLIATPLPQLKAEPGFTELRPATLIDILDSKVERLEPLKTFKAEVRKLTNWNWNNNNNKEDEQEVCSGGGYKQHNQGASRKCLTCCRFRLEEIWKVLGSYSDY